MATNHVNLNESSCGAATPDLTEEFVSLRDGELYDSLFNEPELFIDGPVYTQTENITFDSSARSSGPESIGDGLSFEDDLSWQNVFPPSFATDATSPWIGLSGNNYGEAFGSFESTSPQTISPQVFDTFGAWSDQTITCEPLPDYDHARPITIPQPNHRHRSRHGLPTSSPFLDIPPVLSASPDVISSPKILSLRNRSKSDPRGRSNSLASSGSPRSTKDYGWIQYQINERTGKAVPVGSDKSGARRTKGRTKGLSPEQRREAALMRLLGACSNCRRRKEKCDPGIPCRACLDHFKGDLVHNPCRDTLLVDLSKIFLSERLGWHPTSRSLTSCLGNNNFSVLDNTRYTIPLSLGFGPYLYLSVHPLQVHDHDRLIHRHVIYAWPPSTPTGKVHNHAVLPAILTSDTTPTLRSKLDAHLSLLVTDHFNHFPLFTSQLSVLKSVYILYRHQPPNSYSSHLLHQALKLLVLVHIGGDLTLPPPSEDAILAHLITTTTSNTPHYDPTTIPTPCYIRSQFGSVMPNLALFLMQDVLSRVEKLCLSRNCTEWTTVLAAFLVILMTVESIQYHAAKVPYHAAFDLGPGFANLDVEREPSGLKGREGRELDEKGFETLRNFYRACFAGCHARLGEDWVGDGVGGNEGSGVGGGGSSGVPWVHGGRGVSAEDQFVEAVRETMRRASRTGYLGEKARAELGGEGRDMRWFFDRLVARLLV